ncbi:MAG: hypothetical protein R2865_17000 [Deinococcales bacterium]
MFVTEDEELARQVPDIDLILGGHDHTPYESKIGDTLVWKTGSDFQNFGDFKTLLFQKPR